MFGGYGVEAERAYESEAGFNRPQSSSIQRNPFELPAGYPDQDGYKKSIVAKQNLPFNEPHPGNDNPKLVTRLRCAGHVLPMLNPHQVILYEIRHGLNTIFSETIQ